MYLYREAWQAIMIDEICDFLRDYKSATWENIKENTRFFGTVHKYRKDKNKEKQMIDVIESIERIENDSNASTNNQNIIIAKQGMRHLIDGLNSNVDHVKKNEFLLARNRFNTLIHIEPNKIDNNNLICVGYWGNFMYFNQLGDYTNSLIQIYECAQKYPRNSIKMFPIEFFSKDYKNIFNNALLSGVQNLRLIESVENEIRRECQYRLESVSKIPFENIDMGQIIDMANSAEGKEPKIWSQNGLPASSEENSPKKAMQRYMNEPLAIELYKYWLSLEAKQEEDREDYLNAARTKLKLAQICRSQNKNRDCFLLEDSGYKLIEKAAECKRHYREAAEILNDWATELRKNGQERDAYLMDTTAHKYRNADKDSKYV